MVHSSNKGTFKININVFKPELASIIKIWNITQDNKL